MKRGARAGKGWRGPKGTGIEIDPDLQQVTYRTRKRVGKKPPTLTIRYAWWLNTRAIGGFSFFNN